MTHVLVALSFENDCDRCLRDRRWIVLVFSLERRGYESMSYLEGWLALPLLATGSLAALLGGFAWAWRTPIVRLVGTGIAILIRSGRKGKIEVVPSKPCCTQKDLSLTYTPGMAEPCREIANSPELSFEYTARGNLVAVDSG